MSSYIEPGSRQEGDQQFADQLARGRRTTKMALWIVAGLVVLGLWLIIF